LNSASSGQNSAKTESSGGLGGLIGYGKFKAPFINHFKSTNQALYFEILMHFNFAIFPFYDFLGSGSSDDSNDENLSNNDNDSDWSVDSQKIRKKRKIFDREQKKRLRQFNIGRKDNPEKLLCQKERG